MGASLFPGGEGYRGPTHCQQCYSRPLIVDLARARFRDFIYALLFRGRYIVRQAIRHLDSPHANQNGRPTGPSLVTLNLVDRPIEGVLQAVSRVNRENEITL